MVYGIYVMRDNKVGFLSPTFDLNDDVAQRNFSYGINNNNVMSFSPADFDLFKLGTYDNETAKFELLPIPELVVSGYSVFNGGMKVDNG